ncbi:MAG: hypothetical protein K8F25_15905, partial [Fimbriimonadaceae bacterium]|nr:hypothetical protein [Alphaproteobacteria bacterium]
MSDMLGKIIHRGPDNIGIWTSPTISVGCARLSIIDLKMGNQPICSEDGKLILVCNGEIVNYLELREDLA